jgi:hypothetical protein
MYLNMESLNSIKLSIKSIKRQNVHIFNDFGMEDS